MGGAFRWGGPGSFCAGRRAEASLPPTDSPALLWSAPRAHELQAPVPTACSLGPCRTVPWWSQVRVRLPLLGLDHSSHPIHTPFCTLLDASLETKQHTPGQASGRLMSLPAGDRLISTLPSPRVEICKQPPLAGLISEQNGGGQQAELMVTWPVTRSRGKIELDPNLVSKPKLPMR